MKGFNDLKTLRPDISREWHPTKNDNRKPDDFLVGSHYKVWWKCKKGHEWETSIESRTRKRNASGCAVCSKKKLYKGENDLVTYCNNHIEVKYLLQEWNYQKNTIKPDEIVATSDKNIRLIRIREKGLCIYDNCEYIIRDEIDSDYSLNIVMSKLLNLLNIEYDVNIKRDKMKIIQQYKAYLKNESLELLYPNLVLEWDDDKNNDLKLSNFTKGSHTKVHWKCAKCGHKWSAEIKSRVNGNGCKICGRQKFIEARSYKVLNIDTNIIYESLTDAQRKTGVERHNISNCCKGETKIAGGFHWKYI